jgi:ankyrin repeat protein
MIIAAENGHKDIVELLISKGASYLHYAMRVAARNGHTDIVELLKSKLTN